MNEKSRRPKSQADLDPFCDDIDEELLRDLDIGVELESSGSLEPFDLEAEEPWIPEDAFDFVDGLIESVSTRSKKISRSARTTVRRVFVDGDLSGLDTGAYHIHDRVGSGGMGEVYRATCKKTGKIVALKVLFSSVKEDEAVIGRFHREGKAMSSINHPNVVGIHGVGEVFGRPCIAMEFVEGFDLASMIREGVGMAPTQVLRIALDIARGLHCGHKAGIIHRDIKPENVLVTTDAFGLPHAKLGDFGLARENELTASRITLAGTVLGTPKYMSPEQAKGGATDHRSDVYSLGLTIYEMLTGSLPFDGDSVFTVIEKQIREPVEFKKEDLARIPVSFIDLVGGMCAKAPEQRLGLEVVIARLESQLARSVVQGD